MKKYPLAIDPVKETIETYDKVALDYKKRYEAKDDKNIMQPYLDLFLSKINKNQRKILDIGSGAGFDAKHLSEQGCQVTSIDLSKGFLSIAKKLAPKAEFLFMDVRKMTFENSSFDGVWAAASLLHLPKSDIKKVLKGIYNILDDNGVFYVALKMGQGEKFVVNEGADNLSNARRFFAFYSKDEASKYINEAGFKIDECLLNQNRNNIWMNFYCSKAICS